jgi:hypothetical protein
MFVNILAGPSVSKKYLQIGPRPLKNPQKSPKKFPNSARALSFAPKTLQPLQKNPEFPRTS